MVFGCSVGAVAVLVMVQMLLKRTMIKDRGSYTIHTLLEKIISKRFESIVHYVKSQGRGPRMLPSAGH